jgi:hypothetical protein
MYLNTRQQPLQKKLITPWGDNYYYTGLYVVFGLCIIFLGQYTNQMIGLAYEFGKPPLWDIVHIYLPNLAEYYWVNTILVIIVALRFISLKEHIHNYIFLTITALMMRAVILTVTSYPSPIPSCATNPGNFYWNSCFDMLFSGHIVCITIAVMCIYKDTRPHKFEKCAWILYACLSAIWVASSRQHYFSDTLVGLVVGTGLSLLIF